MVGYTNESGVTLPPLHPRCRCAISYRETERQNGARSTGALNDQNDPKGKRREAPAFGEKLPQGKRAVFFWQSNLEMLSMIIDGLNIADKKHD